MGKGRESEMWSERRILKFTLHGDDGKGINDCAVGVRKSRSVSCSQMMTLRPTSFH